MWAATWQGWFKHCYSIAFQSDRFDKCPSYHLWDLCRAKGSHGCAGYNIAIALYCISIACTFALVHALCAYLRGEIRTFRLAQIPSSVVALTPGFLNMCAVAAVFLQPAPYRADLWWNFYLQLVGTGLVFASAMCMRTRGLGS